MPATARSVPHPQPRKPAQPSAAALANLEAKLAKLEAKHGITPPQARATSSASTTPKASTKPSTGRVDAERLEAKRELDRRMGVGFKEGVISSPTSLRFGLFHESELDASTPATPQRPAAPVRTKRASSAPKAAAAPMDAERAEAKRELDRRMGQVRFVHAAKHSPTSLRFGLFHESELDEHDIRLDELAGKSAPEKSAMIGARIGARRPAGMPKLEPEDARRLDETFGLNIHQGIVVDGGVSLKFGVIAHASEFAAPGREVITQRRIA
jgi:hypothetical protein